jgi:hypothetical protein
MITWQSRYRAMQTPEPGNGIARSFGAFAAQRMDQPNVKQKLAKNRFPRVLSASASLGHAGTRLLSASNLQAKAFMREPKGSLR